MQYRSYDDMARGIAKALPRIPRTLDLVVGVPRSGMLPAAMIALNLNVPLTDINGYLENRVYNNGLSRPLSQPLQRSGSTSRRVLVVDDSVCSGAELARVKNQLLSNPAIQDTIYYGAVFVLPGKEQCVDWHCEAVPAPRVFEWNLMHHSVINTSCVDIDGVLCVDPIEADNDDGPRYDCFLNSATPLWAPTQSIGCLVTCRLEKYRKQTEQWLERHHIKYKELVMMQYRTKAERVAAACHAKYKADVFLRTGCSLFIESSVSQAKEICRLAAKPVYCVDTREMLQPSELSSPPAHLMFRTHRLIGRLWGKVQRRLSSFISHIAGNGTIRN